MLCSRHRKHSWTWTQQPAATWWVSCLGFSQSPLRPWAVGSGGRWQQGFHCLQVHQQDGWGWTAGGSTWAQTAWQIRNFIGVGCRKRGGNTGRGVESGVLQSSQIPVFWNLGSEAGCLFHIGIIKAKTTNIRLKQTGLPPVQILRPSLVSNPKWNEFQWLYKV